jgi:hypothetical protein
MSFTSQLRLLEACSPAIEWVEEDNLSLEQAWDQCTQSHWMIWLLETLSLTPVSLQQYCYCGCNTGKLKPAKIRAAVDLAVVRAAFDQRMGHVL